MKIVHASDLHLDSPLRGLPDYRGAPVEAFRGATRRALKALVALCVEERASLLLLAGDLVDASGRDHKTGLFFAQEMLALDEAGVRVVSIRGNHDAASRVIRSMLLPGNVTELGLDGAETFVIDALGVAIHGQSYPERAVEQSLLPAYAPPITGLLNIGLLHTSAEGSEGHDPYAPCTRRALKAKNYDYFALGHVHAREVLSQAPWVVFPGNLQGRSIRESGPKGATVVTVAGGRVVAVEHRALDVVRFGACRVDVTAARSLDDVAERAHAELADRVRRAGDRALAVRLVVHGASGVGGLLSYSPERRTAALRRAAAAVDGAAIWLEGMWAEVDGDLGGSFTLDVPGEAREAV